MTPPKPPAERRPRPALRCATTFTIVLGTDEHGSIPVLLREDEALPGAHSRRAHQLDQRLIRLLPRPFAHVARRINARREPG